MARQYNKLTHQLFDQFGNRKQQGRLSVLIDTNSGFVYCVPRNVEHIAFADGLLGGRCDAHEYAHLVPSHIDLDGAEQVTSILTGVCGLEIGLGVRHARDQLTRAHDTACTFVFNGEFSLARDMRNKIDFKYAQ